MRCDYSGGYNFLKSGSSYCLRIFDMTSHVLRIFDMTSHASIVILSLLVGVTSLSVTESDVKYQLSLTSGDVKACPGQTVKFTCSVLNPPEQLIPNATIGFVVLNNRHVIQIDEREVDVVNDTVSQFEYHVGQRIGYHYLKCFYGKRYSTSLMQTKKFLLLVYPMPEKVKDFHCIVFNMETMRCNWTYGQDYKFLSDVVLQWRDKRWTDWQNCTNLDAQAGGCVWKSIQTDGDFSMKKLTFMLTLKSLCGKSVTSFFDIDTSKIVKPAPVSNLQALAVNSTCIRLRFSNSGTRHEILQQYIIHISSVQKSQIKSFPQTDEKFATFMLCHLHPNTQYVFKVCRKPVEGGCCSDNSSASARTFSAKPSASPLVTPGGYFGDAMDCREGRTVRNVCLMWKPIPESDRNSETVIVYVSFEPKVMNATTEWPGTSSYGCFLLSCDTNYTAYIKAKNEIGTSDDTSIMNIQRASSGGEKSKFIVEMSSTRNDTALVHIRFLETSGIQQHGSRVFWCRKDINHCDKNSPIEWKLSNKTEVILKLNAPDDFMYGSQHGSNGVQWQTCVYTKDSTPTRVPKNVHVEPSTDKNSLLVTWDKLPCEPGKPYIVSYLVEYCIEDDDLSCQNETVPATGKSRIVLRDLKKDSTYAVTVRGIADNQKIGPKTKPKIATPIDNSIPVAVIIIVVMSFIGILITVLICCRNTRNKLKQYKENASIKIPTGSDVSQDFIPLSLSGDSGYPQSVPRFYSDDESTPISTPGNSKKVDKVSYIKVDNGGGLLTTSSGSETRGEALSQGELDNQTVTDTESGSMTGNLFSRESSDDENATEENIDSSERDKDISSSDTLINDSFLDRKLSFLLPDLQNQKMKYNLQEDGATKEQLEKGFKGPSANEATSESSMDRILLTILPGLKDNSHTD